MFQGAQSHKHRSKGSQKFASKKMKITKLVSFYPELFDKITWMSIFVKANSERWITQHCSCKFEKSRWTYHFYLFSSGRKIALGWNLHYSGSLIFH